MNTEKQIDAKLENNATTVVKQFATSEGTQNTLIRKVGAAAMTYWKHYGRKTGSDKFQALCATNGVRRVIDQQVQKRFASFGFIYDENKDIETIGEGRWQRIADRTVVVGKYGELSWNNLYNDEGKQTETSALERIKSIDGSTIFTVDQWDDKEKQWKPTDVTNKFTDIVELRLTQMFPTANDNMKAVKQRLADEQNKVIHLTSNFFTGLKDKAEDKARAALTEYFKDAPVSILKLMVEVAEKRLNPAGISPAPAPEKKKRAPRTKKESAIPAPTPDEVPADNLVPA